MSLVSIVIVLLNLAIYGYFACLLAEFVAEGRLKRLAKATAGGVRSTVGIAWTVASNPTCLARLVPRRCAVIH